jgi:hypothetical protein
MITPMDAEINKNHASSLRIVREPALIQVGPIIRACYVAA